MDSPRGRIFLIKSLAEGRIGLSDPTVEHLSLCLDCRACETVCPAGVPYGRLIEAAKAEIEHQRPGGPVRRTVPLAELRPAARPPARPARRRRRACASTRRAGCRPSCARTGLVRLLPGTLPAWEALLPTLPPAAERAPLPPVIPAVGPRRARVALLTGCVQSVVFGAAQPRHGPRAGPERRARSSCRPTRAAAAPSTPTAAITRAPSRWPSARSTSSRRQPSTRSS